MKVLAVDPGESTGWSVVVDSVIREAGTHSLDEFVDAVAFALGVWPEWSVPPSADPELIKAIQGADEVVVEDWVLYEWKLQELAWDKCRTARGIGAIEIICRAAGVPCTLQPAKIKDQAQAAGAEELYWRPLHENRHQNDSLQHQVVFHLKRGLPALRHAKAAVAG